ncbi:poly-beta-1,6-N-acetyl-D-glucosamine synthase [Halomonas urumqiensis]|uniref:Poly-beta-1,6-N-acetyl-D-glucosamine synthase n=1 Tax=Halomonas urumqiensis TaxID=1684789 RepID=A0A2N7UD54_9GAMM|nr:poly-beta-1,6-N-acetyl-D-glucosamine synthase [Halomonas urumqiensis]PMR78384.1 poly-beta-1,6 N-acetyl-D-glucosamine synthase [Halomonas urumqiensis]PTB03530.1 poly-beta-1,6 N-acetyl-D-glucosamine synthase [Halomonas urumqiensis]GHE20273.1 poly-beta-1,6 N-acetyl-D-glucosamine synthase [Halomonas urumqiensis]
MTFFDMLSTFAIGYPSLMAVVWITGGIYYYFHWERGQPRVPELTGNDMPPRVTILVPCHNEGANINETIDHLFRHNYRNLEVIAINDGSRDDTGMRLDALAEQYPGLKVLHQTNQGKAGAMNHGLSHATGEFIVGIDGDAVLDYDAVYWMVQHFLKSPRVGCVTGNPRVRTRSTAIGKIQTGEFSSIIGLIKRAQRIYGMVFTISGVICAFRRTALKQVDGWSTDMITEDIDISWRLQLSGWQVRYEPRALCWVLMPETLRGLYMQRLRWAQGGAEAFLRHFTTATTLRNRRFWPLIVEYIVSVLWCYSMLALLVTGLVRLVLGMDVGSEDSLLHWLGGALFLLCLLQFCVSFMIDSRYDRNMINCLFWCIWYPVVYWMLNMATVVVAFPIAVVRRRGQPATWRSPDRGERFRD